jgi:hypothetical protein
MKCVAAKKKTSIAHTEILASCTAFLISVPEKLIIVVGQAGFRIIPYPTS